jgi:hypothetical protein
MKSKIVTHPASMQFLVDTTWNFAHSILWNNFPFANEEIERCKFFIEEYYKKIPPQKLSALAPTYFLILCERILLAKQFLNQYPL